MKKILFSIIGVLAVILVVYFVKQPRIHFIQDEIHLSLYDEVKPYEYIEEVSHMNIKEIQIENHVNNEKIVIR